MSDQPSTMHRRRFIQLAGGGVGLAVLGPLLRADKAFAGSGGNALSLGVMVPTGGEYPLAASSFLEGIKLQLDEAKVPMSIMTEDVPLGFRGAYTAAGALLDKRPNLVIAGITAPAAVHLEPLFAARKVPLIVANLGAHLVRPHARNGFVLHHGLHYWQASFAFGAWAGHKLGRNAFVVAPLADSGYDTVYAFRRGLESSGGRVVGTFVTHTVKGTTGFSKMFAAIEEAKPDFVYGLYSGPRAAAFLRAYRASSLGGRIPLAGGGLMVEDFQLSRLGPAAAGVTNAQSWALTLQGDANSAFRTAFQARTGRAPDPFSLVGYEAALLAQTGLRLAKSQGKSSRHLIDALAGATVAGPRGPLTVDGHANVVRGPIYIREVRRVDGRLANVAVATVAPLPTIPSALMPLEIGLSSGYLNEYLHTG